MDPLFGHFPFHIYMVFRLPKGSPRCSFALLHGGTRCLLRFRVALFLPKRNRTRSVPSSDAKWMHLEALLEAVGGPCSSLKYCLEERVLHKTHLLCFRMCRSAIPLEWVTCYANMSVCAVMLLPRVSSHGALEVNRCKEL